MPSKYWLCMDGGAVLCCGFLNRYNINSNPNVVYWLVYCNILVCILQSLQCVYNHTVLPIKAYYNTYNIYTHLHLHIHVYGEYDTSCTMNLWCMQCGGAFHPPILHYGENACTNIHVHHIPLGSLRQLVCTRLSLFSLHVFN